MCAHVEKDKQILNINTSFKYISKMNKLDLTQYGITGTTEIIHNPSYEELFKEETLASLEGFEKGTVTELGAVKVTLAAGA